MKKSFLFGLAFLVLTTSALSGCFWRVEDEGYRRGDYHERERGDHRGEHHEDHGENGDRR